MRNCKGKKRRKMKNTNPMTMMIRKMRLLDIKIQTFYLNSKYFT
jgi:hypothetical protein